MPKERKLRSVSNDKYRGSPLCCDTSFALRQSQVKEFEEAKCPVCMEHPHNGVLLICSSYENGCRPYMCDTSHRHSNCFDQFRRACEHTPSLSLPHELDETNVPIEREGVALDITDVYVREGRRGGGGEEGFVATVDGQERTKGKLTCPLCRGSIKEWVVVEEARCFMNSKRRSCSSETCDFSGSYLELRKHARCQHPDARPSEADPERQRSWRRLERQREFGDLISSLRSSSYGGEERSDEEEIVTFNDGGVITVLFLVHLRALRPAVRSNSWSGTSRARSRVAGRRRSSRLWGESYEGDTRTSSRSEEDNQFSDEHDSRTRRRRARRRTFIVDVDDDDEEDVEEP
ncbi:unnamed protein product [Cochlearia groenlandica]